MTFNAFLAFMGVPLGDGLAMEVANHCGVCLPAMASCSLAVSEFLELITRLLQYLNASKISWFVSGRGQTSPLPWLGCPQARLIHDLEKPSIRPQYANTARRGSMTS